MAVRIRSTYPHFERWDIENGAGVGEKNIHAYLRLIMRMFVLRIHQVGFIFLFCVID